MNLTILGAGAWGTALAASVASRHATALWVRSAEQADEMRAAHRNLRYLGEIDLPPELVIETDFDAAVGHASRADGLVIVATPMAALREVLARLSAQSGSSVGVFWLCKGFEAGTGSLGHEVAREVCAGRSVGVLSGPSFALEVARGQPTALVAASVDSVLCESAVRAFHGDTLRIYTSSDPVGVEIGGAVKNVLAIATGIADGMGLGANARAALVTRGLAEMTRLGLALGARTETFMGLSGLGDLVLTSTGDLSRNRKVGLLLAKGLKLGRILSELGHVAEGVYSASTALQRARECGVDMPITEAVVRVLNDQITPAEAVEQLMGRGSKSEH
ncbi:NAD(P)H-dependent glycerol-3-phosphate dehydrogenase [soil metagenome]